MSKITMFQRTPTLAATAAFLLVLTGTAVPARAQSSNDPIYELQRALQVHNEESADPEILVMREKTLQKIIQKLRTVSELRRALTLSGWRDIVGYRQGIEETRPQAFKSRTDRQAEIDRAARKEIGDLLAKRVQQDAKRGDATNRLALAMMLETMGTGVRALGEHLQQPDIPGLHPARRAFGGFPEGGKPLTLPDWHGYARRFTPLLVTMTRDPSPQVRVAAARALGKINPEPSQAVPALKAMLQSGSVPERRAAAEGLASMISEINKLQKKGSTQSGVEAYPEEVLEVAVAVTPVAGLGLEDRDPVVRRFSLDALLDSAASLSTLVPEPFEAKDVPPRNEPLTKQGLELVRAKGAEIRENEEALAPLTKALAAQANRLTRALSDTDEQSRLRALRVLELMAQARQRMLRRWESLPDMGNQARPAASAQRGEAVRGGLILTAAQQPKEGADENYLLKAVNPALKNIARQMRDPNPVNRRAAIDLLEMLEDDAAPAVPALIGALSDPDIFVRWSAARTLGRINAQAGASAVPALARALSDPDLDVRLTAAATLEAYGQAARGAIPALADAVARGDVEFRRAAMYALQAIGPDAAQASLPNLIGDLRNEDPRVRRTAAETIGSFGPSARNAVPALRRALRDDDTDVRQAASDALLSIMPQPG
jgi:HEAT repeat protein